MLDMLKAAVSGDSLVVFAEFAKIDEEKREVYGYASTEEQDHQGETVTRDAIKGALPDYMQWGNVREMHQPSAVGSAIEANPDAPKGFWFGCKVVDDRAWLKVKTKVYKGFSIGGRVLVRDPANPRIIRAIEMTEISLVDRPANPGAKFELIKRSPGINGVLLYQPTQIWDCGCGKNHQHLTKLEASSCITHQMSALLAKYSDDQPRDDSGKWTSAGDYAKAESGKHAAKAVGHAQQGSTESVGGKAHMSAQLAHEAASYHYGEAAKAYAAGDTRMGDIHSSNGNAMGEVADKASEATGRMQAVSEHAGDVRSMVGKLSQPDSGFTISATTGNEPRTGYAVSPYPERSAGFDHKDLSDDDLAAYAERNIDLLAKEDHYMGGWHDPATGRVFLDVSVVKATPGEAKALALANDQKAYFDFSTGKSVEVNSEASSGGAVKKVTHGRQADPDPAQSAHRDGGGLRKVLREADRAEGRPGEVPAAGGASPGKSQGVALIRARIAELEDGLAKVNPNHAPSGSPEGGQFSSGGGGGSGDGYIKDKAGKRKVMYHGTATNKPHEAKEGGYFLTESKNLASVYGAKGRVMAVHVKMSHPLDLRDKKNLSAYQSGRNGKERITDYAARTGHDGVIDPAGSHIALSSHQLEEVKTRKMLIQDLEADLSKFSQNQPRDERGRWSSQADEADKSAAQHAAKAQEHVAAAKRGDRGDHNYAARQHEWAAQNFTHAAQVLRHEVKNGRRAGPDLLNTGESILNTAKLNGRSADAISHSIRLVWGQK